MRDPNRLYDFYQNCINTFDYWFNNLEPTPITTAITDKVLLSTYKAEEMGAISYAVKKSKSIKSIRLIKFQKVFWLVFLPYENMTYKYPFLKKHSYLLPVMWVYRWYTILFKEREKIKTLKRSYSITKDNVKEYQNELNLVGLDFNFK